MRGTSPFTTLWRILCWSSMCCRKEANDLLPEETDTCWRSAVLNARQNPSPLGWNPGHGCSANLCHVCERVTLHKLWLKIRLCVCAWQGCSAYLCSFFAGMFPMQSTAVSCMHTQIRLDFFVLHQMQTCSPMKKCVGNCDAWLMDS